ncbi:MAG TPA: peptidoglycan DD-metalloendopeptidase family protein [Alphaproteobacteria bacterium]|nr:peptidoglycan DD-metalloendopeptidase family protein [Alphaproteobacteria bacterium]
MRKRFYIMLVARNAEGELLKIPIPLHYVYVFIAGALIGMLTITGMAGSYTRMLVKTQRFNQLRTEKEALKSRYSELEQIAQKNELQAQALTSLAGEVSSLYGLKADPVFQQEDPASASMHQLSALKTTAMTGAASIGIGMGETKDVTTRDWMRLIAAPTLWPVQGRVTGSFGERIDPFSGEGAFHRGVDISSDYGTSVIAPADGFIRSADFVNGYGRTLIIDHGNGISTLYGHLSGFAVTSGQAVHRGDVIGYVGQSGRSTGPHLHYEVHIYNTPVNPNKYLRFALTTQLAKSLAPGSSDHGL